MRTTSLLVVITLLLGGVAAAQQKAKRRAAPKADQNMTVRQPPAVDRFEPESGPPGTQVTIHGQEFDDTTRVRFNGRWIPITRRTAATLMVTILASGVSDHFVVVKSGFPEVSTETSFFVVRPPTLTSFSPPRGGPGSEVTLVGNHFLPTDKVAVGAHVVTPSDAQPTRIVFRIPPGAGSGKLGIKRADKVVAWSKAAFEVAGQAPVISGFTPTRGPRGTVVRINGQRFEPADRVELGGTRIDVRSRSATHVEVVVAGQPSGTFAIAGREGRRAESAGRFSVLRPLSVGKFSPSFGPPGTRVTVEGTGFEPGDAVYVGTAALTIRTVSDKAIVAELPNGVGSGQVFVVRGAQKVPAKGRFEVLLGPVISNIVPAAATVGATVVVQGKNFLPDASVLLSGKKLAIVRRKEADELAVVIPAGARSGPLTIVTRVGTTQSPILFNVTQPATLSSFFPLHAPPGSRVTLRGANFHNGMRILLGDVLLKELERTETAVVVLVPDGAKSGHLVLESHGKRITSRITFAVDESKAPLAFTASPPAARRGAEVTLTLDPPHQAATVYFDGRPLPVKVLQAGKLLVVTVPADARTGYFEVEVDGKRHRSKQPFKVR